MLKRKKLLLLFFIIAQTMTSFTPVKAQSIDQLGKLMAKQVNSIKGSTSATMTNSEATNDEDTQSLISGIPRPKSQNQKSNITMNREYYSDFVGPLGAGKILIPICNPKCTMADVKKYMSVPNIEQKNEFGLLSFSLYPNSKKNIGSELATYSYTFINGQFVNAIIMFRQGVDRDKCLAWMVKHYHYEESNVEDGMDMHTFKTKDGQIEASVNFISLNGTNATATITYSKN